MLSFRKKAKNQELSDQAYLSNMNRKLMSTSKKIIWILTVNGILWIWCSYILAFMGKDQIAESLSSNICTVIIGQTLGYLITKTVENIFKYNDIGGVSNPIGLGMEPPKDTTEGS